MTASEGGRTAALVRLSAALGLGDLDRIRGALAATRGSVSPREVEEVLLQAYLFVGFPTTLEAMRTWHELEPGSETSGPAGGRTESRETRQRWGERGEGLCRRVYGEAYGKLRANVRDLHPDLDSWMIEEGYGKVLARPGLEPRVRELCIVGLLAVQQWDRQLRSHLRGALNTGASEADVVAALAIAAAQAGDRDRATRVQRLWHQVRIAHQRAES